MTSISRRELIKLASTSLALSSCFKLPITPDSYRIHWLHIEGAPFRQLFDFWPSFNGSESLPGVKTNKVKVNNRELVLPDVWQNTDESILNNWLGIRGITTQSPHLAQCRREWFSPFEKDSSLFNQPKRNLSLTEIFSAWSNGPSERISPYVIDSYIHEGNKHRFESITELNQKTIEIYKAFYSELIDGLATFTEGLKKQQIFENTIVILTSDRGRAPASNKFPTLIEPVWQGAQLSLISGAIRGPINLGDIYQKHPKYPEAYPGTWGTPKEQWTPQHVYQLIKDLQKPKLRELGTSQDQENPWISPRPLQGFFVKLPSGKIV
jgi:hypothetical protein